MNERLDVKKAKRFFYTMGYSKYIKNGEFDVKSFETMLRKRIDYVGKTDKKRLTNEFTEKLMNQFTKELDLNTNDYIEKGEYWYLDKVDTKKFISDVINQVTELSKMYNNESVNEVKLTPGTFIPNVGTFMNPSLKNLILKNSKISTAIGNDEKSFMKKSDVVSLKHHKKPFNTIFTDGKQEFEIDMKKYKLVKPLTKARTEISNHYLQKESFNKAKLLKALGDNDDGYIIVKGKKYIIYNPDSNNLDNARMWGNNTVKALIPDDGGEKQFKYSDIDGFTLNESTVTITKQDMDRLHSGEEVEIDGTQLKFVDESVNEKAKFIYNKNQIILKKSDLGTPDSWTDKYNRAWREFVVRYIKQNNIKANMSDAEYKVKKAFKIPYPEHKYNSDSAYWLEDNGFLVIKESVNESWVDPIKKKAEERYKNHKSVSIVGIGKPFERIKVIPRGKYEIVEGDMEGRYFSHKFDVNLLKPMKPFDLAVQLAQETGWISPWNYLEMRIGRGGKTSKYLTFPRAKTLFDESVNEDEQLDEKLITFSNRAPYGQVVFMAGGAGSGKGFAISNFIDSAGFKVRDVDEMKKQVGKLDKLGKISVDSWYNRYSGNLSPDAREHVEKYVINKGLTISDIAGDLKNPNNVASLHFIVDAMGIKEKWLINMLSGKNNPETLPNLIFDITAKNIKSITKTIPALISQGYKPQNIHLIWVLTNYYIAVQQNQKRERVVPDDIMLKSHEGAARTIWSIVTGSLPKGLSGRIDVILGGAKNTVMYTDSNGNELKGAVKGFTTLPVKKQGGGILPEKQWLNKLYKWVSNNTPKTITLQKPLDTQMEKLDESMKILEPIMSKLKDTSDFIRKKGKYTKIGRYFEYLISDTIKNIKNLNYFYVGDDEEGEDLKRQVPKLRKSLGNYSSLKVNLSGSDESKLKKYLYDSIRDGILDGEGEDMGREDVDFYTAHWLMDNGFTTPFKLHETKSVNEELYDFVRDIKSALGSRPTLRDVEKYLGRALTSEEKRALGIR